MIIEGTGEQAIGLVDGYIFINGDSPEKESRCSTHFLYTFFNNDLLVAHCLDYSTYLHVSLKDYVQKNYGKDAKEMAIDLIKQMTNDLFMLVIDQIFNVSSRRGDLDFTNHKSDEFWNIYRELRRIQDECSLRKTFELKSNGRDEHISLKEQITDVINKKIKSVTQENAMHVKVEIENPNSMLVKALEDRIQELMAA